MKQFDDKDIVNDLLSLLWGELPNDIEWETVLKRNSNVKLAPALGFNPRSMDK